MGWYRDKVAARHEVKVAKAHRKVMKAVYEYDRASQAVERNEVVGVMLYRAKERYDVGEIDGETFLAEIAEANALMVANEAEWNERWEA